MPPLRRCARSGTSDINRCPPGGERVIWRSPALTGRAAKPLDPECGAQAPLLVAVIDEATCIGCTLCIQACPVDAILGAQKRMHTVLPSLCSGCELCVAPCPVDCITLQPAGRTWTDDDADSARERFAGRAVRLERNERVARRTVSASASVHLPTDRARRQAAVADALARARARRGTGSPVKS